MQITPIARMSLMLVLCLTTLAVNSTATAGPKLYVFDCGYIATTDISSFGLKNEDTDVRELFVPCYMIEHENGRLLWDAGLPLNLAGKGDVAVDAHTKMSYSVSLLDQLSELKLKPEDFGYLALSHMHFDHVGAAQEFADATLLIQKTEFDAAFVNKDENPYFDPSLYMQLEANKRVILEGDYDVFGDGSVMIYGAPGHTPGHQVLLVKLENTGPIMLSGDLYHFEKSRELQATPTFNVDAPLTIKSMNRIEKVIAEQGATLWIEHNMALARTLKLAPAHYD
jgi:N-acyl homoserine lactone hydrolase